MMRLHDRIASLLRLTKGLDDQMAVLVDGASRRLHARGKMLVYSESQHSHHLVDELIQRSVSAMRLEDTSERRVIALTRPGDVMLILSDYGDVQQVVRSAEVAKIGGAYLCALIGGDGGMLRGKCDATVVVPSYELREVREVQCVAAHMLVEQLDMRLH